MFSFVRRNERDKVFAVFNFSSDDQHPFDSRRTLCHGEYVDFLGEEWVTVDVEHVDDTRAMGVPDSAAEIARGTGWAGTRRIAGLRPEDRILPDRRQEHSDAA